MSEPSCCASTVESLTVGADDNGNYVTLKLINFEPVTRRLPKESAARWSEALGVIA